MEGMHREHNSQKKNKQKMARTNPHRTFNPTGIRIQRHTGPIRRTLANAGIWRDSNSWRRNAPDIFNPMKRLASRLPLILYDPVRH